MLAYLHGALGAAIVFVSATLASAEDVTVYGLAEGAPCLTENMMPSSEDPGHPVFPYPAHRVAPNTVEITFNGKSCYYDISKVALDKIPPPCGKIAQAQGKTLGIRREPPNTGTFVRIDGKRCTP
jgi:hypothetical protein